MFAFSWSRKRDPAESRDSAESNSILSLFSCEASYFLWKTQQLWKFFISSQGCGLKLNNYPNFWRNCGRRDLSGAQTISPWVTLGDWVTLFSVLSHLFLTSSFPRSADHRLTDLPQASVFWAVTERGPGPHNGWTGRLGCRGSGACAAAQVRAYQVSSF